MSDESPRGLERDAAYALATRALEVGATSVSVNRLRNGERFEVDAQFHQGPYEVRHFMTIADVGSEFKLVAYFNALSHGVDVRYR